MKACDFLLAHKDANCIKPQILQHSICSFRSDYYLGIWVSASGPSSLLDPLCFPSLSPPPSPHMELGERSVCWLRRQISSKAEAWTSTLPSPCPSTRLLRSLETICILSTIRNNTWQTEDAENDLGLAESSVPLNIIWGYEEVAA